ncbi:MAG: putative endoribonuclease [Acidobacteria bacterium]|nr:putative endoribonuclease [Acidobacteriota bacterium]
MSTTISRVETEAAPRAIGPYSQGMLAGDLLFVSGQIPLDPISGELVAGEFRAEFERVLANVDGVVRAAGCDRRRIVRSTVYVTDLGLFAELNEIYAAFFGDHRPARAVVEVAALPRGARVEMEAVAVR